MHTYRVISFLLVKTSLRGETSGRAKIAAWVKKVKEKKKKQAGRLGRKRTGIDRSMQMLQKKRCRRKYVLAIGASQQVSAQLRGWGGANLHKKKV